MLIAGFWGGVGGLALVIGALLGIYLGASQRLVSSVMALGAGVLISSVAFELMEEAFATGGTDSTSVGLLAGAFTYFGANWWISQRGAHARKKSKGQMANSGTSGSSSALVVGSLLDGIPESVAIGVSLLGGGTVSWAMVTAVFLSNIPESMAASAGMKADGRSIAQILGLWGIVLLVSALSAALGYAFLQHTSGDLLAVIRAFAAGAVLTMLASTMLPEAYETEGPLIGLFTAGGFLLSFLLSHTSAQ